MSLVVLIIVICLVAYCFMSKDPDEKGETEESLQYLRAWCGAIDNTYNALLKQERDKPKYLNDPKFKTEHPWIVLTNAISTKGITLSKGEKRILFEEVFRSELNQLHNRSFWESKGLSYREYEEGTKLSLRTTSPERKFLITLVEYKNNYFKWYTTSPNYNKLKVRENFSKQVNNAIMDYQESKAKKYYQDHYIF